MSEPFAYHVFAHRSGRYQTVAALGISEGEAKALEQFFFGQTNNDDYLASLDKEPGIVWRMVSAQGALTRVRQGEPDSNGRATLRFETLLIPPNKLPSLGEQIGDIVLAEWKMLSDGVAISPNPSQKSGSIHPDKVSDVLMAVRSGKRIARRADEFSLRDVSKIIADCTDDPTFTLCFKSLNRTAPVSVNLVSLGITERIMSSPQLKSPREVPIRPRADLSMRASSRTDTLILGAVCIALAVQIVMFWLIARPQRDANSLDQMQEHILSRLEKVQQEHAGQLQKMGTNLASLKSALEAGLQSAKKDLEDSSGRIGAEIQSLNAAIESQKQASEQGIDEVSGKIASQHKESGERIARLDTSTKATKESVDLVGRQLQQMQDQTKQLPEQIKFLLEENKQLSAQIKGLMDQIEKLPGDIKWKLQHG